MEFDRGSGRERGLFLVSRYSLGVLESAEEFAGDKSLLLELINAKEKRC